MRKDDLDENVRLDLRASVEAFVGQANSTNGEDGYSVVEDGLVQTLEAQPRKMLIKKLREILADCDLLAFSSDRRTVGKQQTTYWGQLLECMAAFERGTSDTAQIQSLATLLDLTTKIDHLKLTLDLAFEFGLWKQAIEIGESVTIQDPECVESKICLARSLRNEGRFQDSIDGWNRLIEKFPTEYEFYGELGNTQFAAKRYAEAVSSYQFVIDRNPNDIAAHLSQYAAFREMKDSGQADRSFEAALAIDAVSDDVFESVIKGMIQRIEPQRTLQLLDRWLELSPNHAIANHLRISCIAAIENKTSENATSREYIEQEFDGFANSFERQLRRLEYRGPQALEDLLKDCCAGEKFEKVLDAGCGTGWCGPILRSYSRHLTGIDLSSRMLERARSKSVYDSLHHGELVEFLGRDSRQFDLIVSLDTLVYFGDLSEVLGELYQSLKRGGKFVLTLELSEDSEIGEFELQVNGRFAHNVSYVQRTLSEQGLKAFFFERRVLRIEKGEPVYHVLVFGQQESDSESGESEFRDKSLADKIAIYQELVQRYPDSGSALFNLGNAYLGLKEFELASKCFRAANDLDNDASTLCNLGNAFAQMGKLEDAYEAFMKALGIDADFVPALNNAGRAAFELGRKSEALEHLENALRLDPDNAKTNAFLGNIHLKSGLGEKAAEYYRQSIECDSKQPEIHYLLGEALRGLDRLSDAAASYVRAQQLSPDNAYIYDSLGLINHERGQVSEAAFCFLKALQLTSGDPQIQSHMLYNMLFDQTVESKVLATEAKSWGEKQAARMTSLAMQTNNRGDRKLRIGYVCFRLDDEPTGEMISRVIASHNKDSFEVICYTNLNKSGPLLAETKRHVSEMRQLTGQSPEQFASQIRSDRIDILVDLSGHHPESCLQAFLHRPAPIQIAWSKHPGTSGIPTMDYAITDKLIFAGLEQPMDGGHRIELESGYFLYPVPQRAPAPESINALQNNVLFGCVSEMPYLSPDAITLWAQILIEVNGSRLLLSNRGLGDPNIRNRLVQTFAGAGISESRVEITCSRSRSDRLAAWQKVDIGLDPFPVSSPHDCWDGLFMGRAVISKWGNELRERGTGSLLKFARLNELIVKDKSGYVEKAIKLAGDVSKRKDYLTSLRARVLGLPNCDDELFTLQLENEYRRVWQRHRETNHKKQ